MSNLEQRVGISGNRWLMLVHQLPPKPPYFRVKIWRRLQGLGAVLIKSSVYALPASAEAQEDLEWLLREIQDGGGEALICEARLVSGLSDQEIRSLFDRDRDRDYEQLAKEARELEEALVETAGSESLADARARLTKLTARSVQVQAIDFFGANGR